jgi:hypothetical protein
MERLAAVVKRRRVAVVAAVLASQPQASGPRGEKQQKPRHDWDMFIRTLPRAVFRRMFRMTRDAFMGLLTLLEPHIETKQPEKANGNSGAIKSVTRLAVALRFLAGGSPWDIALAFNIHAVSTVYETAWRVVEAIDATPALQCKFPIDDPAALAALERDFALRSRSQVLRGVVGAVDGCIFWQKNPGGAVKNPRRRVTLCLQRDDLYEWYCAQVLL